MEDFTYEELDNFIINIKPDLKIDELNLIAECKKQPSLHDDVGEKAITAKVMAKRSKNDFELVRAQTETDVREFPEKYHLVKVTENSVSAAVVVSKAYQTARLNQIEAEQISDRMSVLYGAVEQRKSMIRDLVTLFTFMYSGEFSKEMGTERGVMREVVGERIRELRRNRNGKEGS